MKQQHLRPLLSGLTLAATVFGARPSYAHFLWAEIDNQPAPALHLSFAEEGGEATNGVPLDRIKAAQVWDMSGKTLTTTPDGATLAAPLTTAVAGAHQNWGVLDKRDAGRGLFLLEYYAKAARSLDAAGQSANLPLEIFLRRDGAEVVATVQQNGKPVPAAQVALHEPAAVQSRDLTTDAKGELRFTATAPGLYGLRAAVVENKKGEYEGKAYDLTRYYSTLTFSNGTATPTAIATAPLAAQVRTVAAINATTAAMGNEKADPAAYALLKGAHDARQVLPVDFPGYTATVVFRNGDKSATGTVRSVKGEKTSIEINGLGADDKEWLDDQVASIISHRSGGDFAQGDGRNPLVFGTLPDNSFGKLIEVNDRMHSSYRVWDNKLMEVTRVGGGSRFTVSMLQTMEGDAGKYLPVHFIVAFHDEKTGALQKVEGYRDSYTQVGGYWLPASRMVVSFGTTDSAELRQIQFKDFKLIGH